MWTLKPTVTHLKADFCKAYSGVANSSRNHHPKHLKQNMKYSGHKHMMIMIVIARCQSISHRSKVVTEFRRKVSLFDEVLRGWRVIYYQVLDLKCKITLPFFDLSQSEWSETVKLGSDPGLMMCEQWTPKLNEQEHLPNPWEVQVVLLWPERDKLYCWQSLLINSN